MIANGFKAGDAGNTYYHCESGVEGIGSPGIAFYMDGKTSFAGHSTVGTPSVCIPFLWDDNWDTYAEASAAQLDANSRLVQITIRRWISSQNQWGPYYSHTCTTRSF